MIYARWRNDSREVTDPLGSLIGITPKLLILDVPSLTIVHIFVCFTKKSYTVFTYFLFVTAVFVVKMSKNNYNQYKENPRFRDERGKTANIHSQIHRRVSNRLVHLPH